MTDVYLTHPGLNFGSAQKAQKPFMLEYAVAIQIEAPAETIWELLTDASQFSSWNSTVISVSGEIAKGQNFSLLSKLAPERPFKLSVSAFEPVHKMAWKSGSALFGGERSYTLEPRGAYVEFTMREVFKGPLLPVIAGSLPDFCRSFEHFAADLKKAAEARAK